MTVEIVDNELPFLLHLIRPGVMPHPEASEHGHLQPSTPTVANKSTAGDPVVELELDHAVAFSTIKDTLIYHPNGINYIYPV